MLFPTLGLDLNFHTIEHSSFQFLIPNIHSHECAMRGVEVKRLDSLPDVIDLVRRQRDHVGNRPLKHIAGQPWWARMRCVCRLQRVVSRDGQYETQKHNADTRDADRYSNNSISDEKLLLPMQHQISWKMPTSLDSRHAR